MSFETIDQTISARGIATITLNRPDKGNALNPTLIDELSDCFGAFASDPAVRVVILRGAGKHFCAGADLGGRDGAKPRFTLAGMLERVDRLPKPTIAVVHGAAVGGGLALATCCDVVLATPEAFFSIPETRIGMAPSPPMAALFARAVGWRNMRRYGLSGERIVAEEARRIGLVGEIHPAEILEARVEAIADAMLQGAPGAVAELKTRIAEFTTPPTSAVFEPAARDAKHSRTNEAEEGIAAFREKRSPSWYPKS